MKRRLALGALAAGAAAAAWPARAQNTRIVFGYTAVADFATVFVAAQEGYFKKRNLDVELKFIALNSTIPAAIESGSIQIGGPTPSVFLQAVDGGLDQVVVAGGGLTAKSNTNIALVGRAGSGIRVAQDCLGKKIGVPGLGAFLHVTLRAWLKQNGVDHRKVTFIEASFPQHGDMLRGGSVDAVVTGDPFMARILDSGIGYVVSYYGTFLDDGNPILLHVASRDWAEKNRTSVRAFRQAIQEAAVFVRQPSNMNQVRAAIGAYIKLPPEVLAKTRVSPPGPEVTEAQLNYWVRLMEDQGMLRTKFQTRNLLVN